MTTLRMQEAVDRYSQELRSVHGIDVQMRVGLNSGEVVVRSIGSDLHMDYTAVGQATHVAARMERDAGHANSQGLHGRPVDWFHGCGSASR